MKIKEKVKNKTIYLKIFTEINYNVIRVMLHISLSRIDSVKVPCNLLGNEQSLTKEIKQSKF